MTDQHSHADRNDPVRSIDPSQGAQVQDSTAPTVSRRSSLVRVVSESAAIVDVAAICITAVVCEFLYSGAFMQIPLDLRRTLGISLTASAAAVGMFAYFRLYSSSAILRPGYTELKKTLGGWFFVIISLIVVAFLTKTSANFSRGWATTWALSTPGLILAGRYAVRIMANRIIDRGKLARYVAIVGAGHVANRLALHMRSRSPEIVLVGVFDDRSANRDDAANTIAPIGTTADLVTLGTNGPLDEIVITFPMNAQTRINKTIDNLAVLPVDIRVCAGLPIIEGTTPRVTYLNDMPLISVLNRPISEWAWMTKSAFDRVASGLLLVATAPLLLIIAIAVKLDSQGPALFRQRRHGFNHEIITVLKFRTMTVMEDGDVVRQASWDDHRITRVGHFLRRTSLDELPQLFNVLKGDMSLVGPRPHALAHNDHFAKIIGQYANRHRVKPGITGLAQINGLRGETDTLDKMAARIKIDLQYIENWSLWVDIKILWKTALIVLWQPEAY